MDKVEVLKEGSWVITASQRETLMYVLNAQIKRDVKPDAAYFEAFHSVMHLLNITEIDGKSKALGGLRPEVREFNSKDTELLALDWFHRLEASRKAELALERLKKEEAEREKGIQKESVGSDERGGFSLWL